MVVGGACLHRRGDDGMMDKREFLKTSGVILTGSLLQHYISAEAQEAHRTNWAGNYEYHAKNLISPKTTEEVQAAVKSCSTLKALGARHSFNGIADNLLNQISLKQLDTMTLDEKARTVTVGGGDLRAACSLYRWSRVRAAQPGLAAAHLRCRRVCDCYTRLGQ